MHTIKARWLIGTMMTLVALAASAADPVGRVQLASGAVQIITPERIARAAVRGDVIHEGDTILTGKDGAAHLRMTDEGIIAMRADSRLVIDAFRWTGKEDGNERSVVSLVKGGFRAITGVIGRTNKSQYIVNTATATIGIRGTDHEPFYIPPPEAGETPPAPPGTYNKVNVGETFIRSGKTTLELGANEVGFASVQPDAAPVKLERVPEFMRATPLPRGRADPRGIRDTALRDVRGGGFVRALSERNLSAHPLRQFPAFLLRTADEDFDLGGQSGVFRRAPPGTALSVSMLYEDGLIPNFASGTMAVGDGKGNSILLSPANEPLIVSDSSGFRYARQTATVVDRGSAAVDDATVKWGIYAGGLRFDEKRGVSRVLLLTFMQASMVTPSEILTMPGTAVFGTTAGFTLPVDENRQVGGVARLSATVVFGANPMITAYDLNVMDGSGRTWVARLTGSQSLKDFSQVQQTANLDVICAGACAATGAGAASGRVIGSNRGGLISSYGLKAGLAIVTGSIVVK